jgi:hypothetical protein
MKFAAVDNLVFFNRAHILVVYCIVLCCVIALL